MEVVSWQVIFASLPGSKASFQRIASRVLWLASPNRYNRHILRTLSRPRLFLFLLTFLLGSASAYAQPTERRTLIVFPFANNSGTPGLEWIGDAFPELLAERLSSPSLYVLDRGDRIRAFDQMGIPVELHPTRATLYRIAEQMGADYVVFGTYGFDGRTFTATAHLLDIEQQRLLAAATENAPLVELIDVQTELAWDLLHLINPKLSVTKDAFRAAAPVIRLDAFENYVRGIMAATPQEKIRRFRQAIRFNPNYNQALLELGKAYYAEREYDQAISWLQRIPRGNSVAREASFFLGLAAYYKGDFAAAEAAFTFLASQLPLTEVYNNLAVAASRRGEKTALAYFQKAVEADPNDPDYRFNLGVAYYRSGDFTLASKHLREAVNLRPSDSEAKSLLETFQGPAALQSPLASTAGDKAPLERIKRNYDESSFRQLALEIQAASEQRLSKTDSRTHAQFHVRRGHELLAQGFVPEADGEFREAISLDPANAEAHSGLACVLEVGQKNGAARSEAESALRIKAFAEPLLVLARLDLRENNPDRAAQNVGRALQLEPSNGSALALRRTIAAKLAEKAQPLPNP